MWRMSVSVSAQLGLCVCVCVSVCMWRLRMIVFGWDAKENEGVFLFQKGIQNYLMEDVAVFQEEEALANLIFYVTRMCWCLIASWRSSQSSFASTTTWTTPTRRIPRHVILGKQCEFRWMLNSFSLDVSIHLILSLKFLFHFFCVLVCSKMFCLLRMKCSAHRSNPAKWKQHLLIGQSQIQAPPWPSFTRRPAGCDERFSLKRL